MAYENLRAFIRALEQAGELKRIGVEVDPVLEIAEITDRVSKQGGPALLFEKPQRLPDPGADQHLRLGPAHEPGAGGGLAGAGGRPHPPVPGLQVARRPAGEDQDAAEAGGDRRLLPPHGA